MQIRLQVINYPVNDNGVRGSANIQSCTLPITVCDTAGRDVAIKRQMRNYAPTDLTIPKGKSYRARVLADVHSKTLKHAREYFIFNSYSLYLRSSSAIYTPLHLLPLSVIANLCSAFTDLSNRCCSVSIIGDVIGHVNLYLFYQRNENDRNFTESRERKIDN